MGGLLNKSSLKGIVGNMSVRALLAIHLGTIQAGVNKTLENGR